MQKLGYRMSGQLLNKWYLGFHIGFSTYFYPMGRESKYGQRPIKEPKLGCMTANFSLYFEHILDT